jgi:[acyl-carrier-protein] S-malonyltransferase
VIAFVFPGQGSQKVGMARALAEAFPVCRSTFDEADAVLGDSLSTLCFEGPEDRLMLTEHTQPAILTASIAAWRLLDSKGFRPAFVAGHSLGEYSANVAAGTMTFADAVSVVRRRGRYMQEAVPVGTGAMAAILGLDAALVAQACEEAAQGDVVSPANINGGGQVVIAGAREAVARAGERAKALGARRVLPLPVSAPSLTLRAILIGLIKKDIRCTIAGTTRLSPSTPLQSIGIAWILPQLITVLCRSLAQEMRLV